MRSHSKDQLFIDTLPVLKVAFFQGFEQGRMAGFVEGIQALKPALSDGLRSGSSECGRAMRKLRILKQNLD